MSFFSWLCVSGMTMTLRYPRALPTSARPIPVLPAVPSTMTPPGSSTPRSSASLMMKSAARSLTEPPGLRNSALPRMVHPVCSEARRSRISGVWPTVSVNPSRICIFEAGSYGPPLQPRRENASQTIGREPGRSSRPAPPRRGLRATPVDLRGATIAESAVLHRRAAFLLPLLLAPLGGSANAAAPPDSIVMGKGIDDIVSLDPAEVYEFSGAEVMGNVYDRLVEGDPQDATKIRPGLAESWSNDPSGRVFTFRLRRDARFASGAPVTAGDAAFSLQRVILLNKGPALVLRQLGLGKDDVAARVRATDDATLVIETGRAIAPSLVYFCLTAS